MHARLSRREFLRRASQASLVAGTASSAAGVALARPRSPNEKLNLGIIGVGGRGEQNLAAMQSENIVALCDVNSDRLAQAARQYPRASTYADYRRLLDVPGLDAVVVSTPDHSHAIAVVGALHRKLDVYCEQPLAHSLRETRRIREWTLRQQAVTQMGTQWHASDNARRVVEWVQADVLGSIERVHVWRSTGKYAAREVANETPPANIDYDLWTGPAPLHPYRAAIVEGNWRYWWDYGNGWLGEWGCHDLDLPFWALQLRVPRSVRARGERSQEQAFETPDNMRVDYHFAERDDLPQVHLTWWLGTWRPEGAESYQKSNAVLFEGERGRLLADFESHQLFLEPGLAVETPGRTLPISLGHHRDWIMACKTRSATTCNFDDAGALTEAVLLGNVSYRLGGTKLDWDSQKLRCPNCPEAEPYLEREYRSGWKLEA